MEEMINELREAMVSVIVPMYNAEQFVKRLYESISAQTYKDFELLLCDDGSSDSSLQLAQDIATTDTRVRVLALPHGGVSRTRNAGMEAAQGEYFAFVDVDDTVPADMLECLVSKVDADVDMVVAGYTMITHGHSKVELPPVEGTIHLMPYADKERVKAFVNSVFAQSPWSKLYRTSVMRQYGLRFNTQMRLAEDAHFIRQYLIHGRRIECVQQSLYEYITERNRRKYVMDAYEAVAHVDAMLEALDEIEQRFDIKMPRKRLGDIYLYRKMLMYYLPQIKHRDEFVQQLCYFRERYGCPPARLRFPITRYIQRQVIFRWPNIGYYLLQLFP